MVTSLGLAFLAGIPLSAVTLRAAFAATGAGRGGLGA